jgi:hypothetical protein
VALPRVELLRLPEARGAQANHQERRAKFRTKCNSQNELARHFQTPNSRSVLFPAHDKQQERPLAAVALMI